MCLRHRNPYFGLLKPRRTFPVVLVLLILLEGICDICGRGLWEGIDRLRACLPQGLGMKEWRMPTNKENPEHSWISPGGLLANCSLLNIYAAFFQRNGNINFLERFENAIIAQSSGFYFFPSPCPILFHKLNAFFVSCIALETGHVPHKGNNSVHRSHFFSTSRSLSLN